MRVQRNLDRAHHADGILTVLLIEELLFADTDSVLAAAGATHRQRSCDQAIGQALGLVELRLAFRVDRKDEVKVAVAGVANQRADKRRTREICFRFRDAVRQTRYRHARIRRPSACAGP